MPEEVTLPVIVSVPASVPVALTVTLRSIAPPEPFSAAMLPLALPTVTATLETPV